MREKEERGSPMALESAEDICREAELWPEISRRPVDGFGKKQRGSKEERLGYF
jgi:hypothetical protein